MRTTVDIPDVIYRRLKSAAVLQGCSVKELVLRAVRTVLKSSAVKRSRKAIKHPIIDSERPGRLHLTNRKIDKLLLP